MGKMEGNWRSDSQINLQIHCKGGWMLHGAIIFPSHG